MTSIKALDGSQITINKLSTVKTTPKSAGASR